LFLVKGGKNGIPRKVEKTRGSVHPIKTGEKKGRGGTPAGVDRLGEGKTPHVGTRLHEGEKKKRKE